MSYWADKRVLVTGGGGFLGSHVVERLHKVGCAHVFVARSREYNLTRQDEVSRLFADLQQGKHGWPVVAGRATAEIVVHLAGLVGGIGANKARPADFFYDNLLLGTLLLHESWRHGVTKFVAAGAGCGYPEHAPMPLKEESFWDGLPQKESAPYSLAKRLLSIQADAYYKQHGFVSIIGIPGNVYGPNDNFDLEASHVVPGLVRKFVNAVSRNERKVEIWGSGRPSRDFVYAGDVAEGLLLAAEKYDQPQLVNLSSGTETSISELVEILSELTGFKGEIVWDRSRPDGQLRRCFDMTKASRDLGFKAETNLRMGLKETVDWFKANQAVARTTA